MDDFLFLRPYWFLAIFPLLVIMWSVFRYQHKRHSWSRVCDEKLLKHLLIGKQQVQRQYASWVILLTGLLSIVALAGPAWEKLPQPVFRQQSSLIIVFDLSRSMLASDVNPSRLFRARLKLLDILKQRKEGQTALLVYSGEVFVVTPLTDDTQTISTLVASLEPSMMPSQGSRPNLAIKKAVQLFQQAGNAEGDILLITDNFPEKYVNEVNKLLYPENFSLSILSVGTEQGAPIKLPAGGFLQDSDGNIVIAQVNAEVMSDLAAKHHGLYSTLTVNDSDINSLVRHQIFNQMQRDETNKYQQSEQWREQGPWLILLLLPIILLFFRRGLVFILVILVFPVCEDSIAFEWNDLWMNDNNRAKKMLTLGNAAESAELFTDENWKAAARYKAGEYKETLKLLENNESENALYNKANALAKLGRYEQAIASYNQVLKRNPKHTDALYNKKLVEDQMKQKKKSDSPNNKQQKNNKNNQNKDNQKKNQQNKDQQNNESSKNKNEQNGSESQQQSQQQPDKNKDTKENSANQNPQNSDEKNQKQNQKKNNKQQQADSKQQKNAEENQQELESAKLSPEQLKAVKQWLRQVPDDPAGLMRRKFKYQYQQNKNRNNNEGSTW